LAAGIRIINIEQTLALPINGTYVLRNSENWLLVTGGFIDVKRCDLNTVAGSLISRSGITSHQERPGRNQNHFSDRAGLPVYDIRQE
jgi:hypothetical protein